MMPPIPMIRRVLDEDLREFTSKCLHIDPDHDIAWTNIPFASDLKKLHLAVFHMYDETVSASCGEDGFNRISGTYQISIFELLGVGTHRAEMVAASLVEHFYMGRILDACDYEVRITNSWASSGISEETRFHIPVSVNWYSYVQRDQPFSRKFRKEF